MTHTCKPTTFHEIYGRGELSKLANEAKRNLSVRGLRVVDLSTRRPDGRYWDLSVADHRREAFRLVQQEAPDWVSFGPPCTQIQLTAAMEPSQDGSPQG